VFNIKLPKPTKTIRVTTKNDVFTALKRTGGGVYFLYGSGGSLLYIGKTNSFRSRIADHLRGDGRSKLFARQIEMVRLYRVDDGMWRDMLETYCINTYRPIYNSSKVYDDNDSAFEYYELSRLLGERDDAKDRMREIREELNRYDDPDEEYDEYYYEDDQTELLGVHLRLTEEYAEVEREYLRLNYKIQDLGKRAD
jgi:hypothetical protein